MMMASAFIDSIGKMPSENFPAYPSYGWLSPRISFSRDFVDDGLKIAGDSPKNSPEYVSEELENEICSQDFEFCLEDPVTMLPADELFSDGKLVPLQMNNNPVKNVASTAVERHRETLSLDLSGTDSCILSPKAPRCSSRWKELLGLRKASQQHPKPENIQKNYSIKTLTNPKSSLKQLLRGSGESNPKSSADASMSLPLLREVDSESVSHSSRFSLSSNTSDQEDLPRFSFDSDKPNSNILNRIPPKVKAVKLRRVEKLDNQRGGGGSDTSKLSENQRARVGRSPLRRSADQGAPIRGVSVDSPRMNSSGKIVFQGLERSSSSPSSFNGKDYYYGNYRLKDNFRGMERSYSANVRVMVSPVLNVPVCSRRSSSKQGCSSSKGNIFGLSHKLFSPQKKDISSRTNKGRNDSKSGVSS
ncbi:hypothetical protein AMTRI_Chr02g211730 [Amborella trichopoda]